MDVGLVITDLGRYWEYTKWPNNSRKWNYPY